MTRKDFVIVAGILEIAKDYMPPLAWQALVLTASNELAQTNANFDYAKFAKACGWEMVA